MPRQRPVRRRRRTSTLAPRRGHRRRRPVRRPPDLVVLDRCATPADGSTAGSRGPPMLKRFLDGDTRLARGRARLRPGGLRRGDPSRHQGTRIAVVDGDGQAARHRQVQPDRAPCSTPATPSTSPRCWTRPSRCWRRCTRPGVEAFPAYGTLLGAVREQDLIGHDNDADLGYVSRHTHPLDVIRESFRLQRRLREQGYADRPLQRRRVQGRRGRGRRRRCAGSTCSAASSPTGRST